MIIPLVALVHPLTWIGLPNDKYEFCNQIQNADIVAIVSFESYIGKTLSTWLNGKGESSDTPVGLYRFQLRTIVDLSDSAPPSFVFVIPTDPSGSPSGPEWGATNLDWAVREQGLVYGFRAKPPSNLIPSDGDPDALSNWSFSKIEPAEYGNAGWTRFIRTPEQNYVREGSTPNQRLMSVFSQVYASDPNRYREFLYHMMSPAPSWVEEMDGSIRFTIEGFRDANIFNFFREKIEPRLIRAAGNDPLRQLWVTYFRAQAANPSLKGEYFTKLDELERTYPNPNEQGLVPGVLRPKPETREFWLQKIRSRLSTVRKFSLFGLEMKRYNLEPVIEVLRTEESWEVLQALQTFFQGVKDSETPPYRDAPSWKLDQKTKTLTNRSEIIEYWSTRVP